MAKKESKYPVEQLPDHEQVVYAAEEAWTRFAAAAVSCPGVSSEGAVQTADYMIVEWRKRFDPPRPSDD